MSRTVLSVGLLLCVAGSAALAAGPVFTDKGELVRPADYREWVFLASGLGMTYGPNRPQAGQAAPFDNVFVNPEGYKAFMKTGRWPDGTLFMLEIRSAEENVSINAGGRTQGALRATEASVKDSKRYPDGGWAYFSFDGPNGIRESAAPFPRTAGCYGCHSRNAAVEWTFTQFYPTAFEAAQKLGTVRPDYDPARKAE
jgi:hypothetical protein